MTDFERACRGYGMDNQRMLVIVFMYLDAKYSDWEGFIHQLGKNVGMVLSGTRMW